MKTYGELKVQLHAFLTSALGGGEWTALRLGRFTPGTQWIFLKHANNAFHVGGGG